MPAAETDRYLCALPASLRPGISTYCVGLRQLWGRHFRLVCRVLMCIQGVQVDDIAILFSQDQDLSEAANEIRTISVEQQRWIKIACAFPYTQQTGYESQGLPMTCVFSAGIIGPSRHIRLAPAPHLHSKPTLPR
jgi:hypothetical protein